MSKPTNTHKLGEIVDQPKTPAFPKFNTRMRLPGWYPDADGAGGRVPIFLEEAIEKINGKFRRFPVGESGGTLFAEPIRPNGEPKPDKTWIKYYADKEAFDRWIQGGNEPNNNSEFSQLILGILPLIRNYNRTLYKLRRLHFGVYSDSERQYFPAPLPGLIDITNPDPFPIEYDDIQKSIYAVEAEWITVTAALNRYIDNVGKVEGQLGILAADMVEVNGYIVSIRIIAAPLPKPNAKGEFHFLEVGGSSSHVSISSPFK